MQYPVKHPDDWRQIGKPGLFERLQLPFRNRRFRQRAKSRDGIELTRVHHASGDLGRSDVVLICIMKNAEKYLPSFLAHYRRLGVKRFAFVDDRSSDGTRPLLLAAGDVDLYESNVGFSDAGGGLAWRDMLVDLYGRGRWYVSIDSDEYLIFPGCETRPLSAFIADLERIGAKRSLASMIDIYPDGALGAAQQAEAAEALPTAICPLYDGDGYGIGNDKFCTAIRGGPRRRLFGTNMRLTKFPVIFADDATQFNGGSHHGPLPIARNFSPVQAVLLHYKFSPGAVEEFTEIAARGTHYNGASYYKSIVGHAGFNAEADFRYAGSLRFEGSEAMLRQGFMQDIRN